MFAELIVFAVLFAGVFCCYYYVCSLTRWGGLVWDFVLHFAWFSGFVCFVLAVLLFCLMLVSLLRTIVGCAFC